MDPRIEQLQRRAAAEPEVIMLAGGLPANELFPRAALSRAFARMMAMPAGEGLQYGWPEGSERLRAWVAARLVRRGAKVDPEDVIITNGAQQALDIAVHLLFREGDRVGCDPESYPGALDLMRARGIAPLPLSARVAGLYVMPEVSNPRGLRLSGDERERLLRRARALDIAVIEDDAYADLSFDGPPGPPLLARDRARTWHVGTLSKILCPGLRIGWLVPPRRWHRRAFSAKRDTDLQANGLAQTIVGALLAHEDFDRFTERARRFYARRAYYMTRALGRHLPSWRFDAPQGGFAVWIETGEPGDDVAFLEVALAHHVAFDPGCAFRACQRGGGVRLLAVTGKRADADSPSVPRAERPTTEA
jgi:2-aminoadipate transaminase